MSHTRKTTEFSTHLSRSRMRRYLHGQLDANETRQVELHLANCAHCSAALVNYIETEEPDQYNTYAKQLSGKLKEQKIAKRPTLSNFQIRALRASAAVVTLLIFSFFGVKTIIDKEVGAENTVAVKGKPVVASEAKAAKKTMPVKEATEQKAAKKITEKKADNRLAENRPVKVRKQPATTKKATPVRKEVAKSTKPSTTKAVMQQPKKVEKPAAQPKQKVEEMAKPKVAAAEKAETTEKQPEPVKKVAKVEKLDKAEDQSNQAQEAKSAPAPIKTLPAVEKMDASKKLEVSKPVGSTTPQVAPIPGGRLR
ncbi:MAG: zf-HC2 domain-containing protein [Bacteroidota bacterium]